ncbi:MAG: hypothetical protein Q9191_005108 [Dirinaria sp. TL-2023a]
MNLIDSSAAAPRPRSENTDLERMIEGQAANTASPTPLEVDLTPLRSSTFGLHTAAQLFEDYGGLPTLSDADSFRSPNLNHLLDDVQNSVNLLIGRANERQRDQAQELAQLDDLAIDVHHWRDEFNQCIGELNATKLALNRSNSALDAISHGANISTRDEEEARKMRMELTDAHEKLAKLEEDKKKTALAYADMANQVVGLERINHRLANRISSLAESNDQLTSDNDELWRDTVRMRRLLDAEPTELNERDQRIVNLQQDIASLIRERRSDAIEIDQLQSAIADKDLALEWSEKKCDLHKRPWNNSKATANQLRQDKKRLQSEVKDLRSQKGDLQDLLDNAYRDATRTESDLIEALNDASSRLDAQTAEKDNSMTEKEEALASLTSLRRKANVDKRALQSDLEAKDVEIASQKERISQLMLEKDATGINLNKIITEVGDLTRQVESLNAECQQLQATREVMRAEMDMMENQPRATITLSTTPNRPSTDNDSAQQNDGSSRNLEGPPRRGNTSQSTAEPSGRNLKRNARAAASEDRPATTAKVARNLRWTIEEVREPGFTADPIPAQFWAIVRQQLEQWDTRDSKRLFRSQNRVCAETYLQHRSTDWDEEHTCRRCRAAGRVCVAIQRERMDILPLRDGSSRVEDLGH